MIDSFRHEEPIGKSDHVLLVWKYESYIPRIATKMVKYLYDKGNYEQMKQDLRNLKWETELTGKSSEEMWNEIEDTTTEMVITHVPHKTFTRKTKMNKIPLWMDDRVRLKKKKSACTRSQRMLKYAKERKKPRIETRRAVKEYKKEVAKLAIKVSKEFLQVCEFQIEDQSHNS